MNHYGDLLRDGWWAATWKDNVGGTRDWIKCSGDEFEDLGSSYIERHGDYPPWGDKQWFWPHLKINLGPGMPLILYMTYAKREIFW